MKGNVHKDLTAKIFIQPKDFKKEARRLVFLKQYFSMNEEARIVDERHVRTHGRITIFFVVCEGPMMFSVRWKARKTYRPCDIPLLDAQHETARAILRMTVTDLVQWGDCNDDPFPATVHEIQTHGVRNFPYNTCIYNTCIEAGARRNSSIEAIAMSS